MIVLASLVCWGLALLGHGLLQPKIRRLLHVGDGRRGMLRVMRLGLPLVALAVSARLDMPLAILVWVGTFSVGGLLAGGALAAVAVYRRGGC
ncbi:hypothetical protein [Gluconacetobacter takamatsuzukensis]|uniref:DUF3325 domain-containing protein n=1 Tax=Gluconacetobacter takamatsuzukensis TaxID=1286190 RepID=A0A7W4KD71_9PROT|nr:hypothetical protein [Gluconacetobacter takamatsuzukensis]MBB2204763.1 hypothetical protein [Gluconacetobacter takamatsuzukensis]